MEKLAGYVEHIIYQNKENGYTVLNFVCGGEEVTCVGNLLHVSEGENLEMSGEYTAHPVYGRQFKVDGFEEKAPEDEEAIERYLGSGAIKGIGLALAARIVRHFKSDTFRIIEEEPERLAEVHGISERKAMEVAAQVNEKRDLRQAMIFLQKYGIHIGLAAKIYRTYGTEVYAILKENPYRLAEDVEGVGFKTADEIAAQIGIRPDSEFRIKSGILYCLQQAAGEGHTYLPQQELTEKTSALLGVAGESVEKCYMDLAIERKIMLKQQEGKTCVYAASYYYMEANVAAMLKQLGVAYDVADSEVEQRVHAIERQTKMELDEHQLAAVKGAARNGLLVITGGPGTGKTTTINTIIRFFEEEGLDIFLAAPTGRAAKRMSETTGMEARTIHRMLENTGGVDGKGSFERNEKNPLETDVIIVDEMSMVDISLMNSLLKAVVTGTRLILVGDVNQLPSVGAGNVLGDIIESGVCHVVRLTKIFRQAADSDIVVNAHKINKGEPVALDNDSADFFFLKRYDADRIINVVLQLVGEKLPKYVEATEFDIQVLTPMRKGLLGVERLNSILQRYLNPADTGKREKEHGQIVFREGDKVMQVKNNYQLPWEIGMGHGFVVEKGMGIFNGEMGIVREINAFSECMKIEFDDGKMVEYPFGQLEELELAYAVTIHKSQGSEYPAVVMPLLGGPPMLYNRNLLYTAVTRAQRCVAIVGDEKVFDAMEQNTQRQKRFSGLLYRLRE